MILFSMKSHPQKDIYTPFNRCSLWWLLNTSSPCGFNALLVPWRCSACEPRWVAARTIVGDWIGCSCIAYKKQPALSF